MINLNRCNESCNTLNDLFNRICVFNVITGTNAPKTIAKQLSCECKCKFDGRKCVLNQKWNNHEYSVSEEIRKNIMCVKKYMYVWNPASCTFENR